MSDPMDKPPWTPKRVEGPSLTPDVPGSGTYRELDVTFDHLLGWSKNEAYLAQIERARKAACSDLRVLLLGETGTGKNYLAQAIHNESRRAFSRFKEVLLPAGSESLASAELFGVRAGAYTGAVAREGAFKLADKGTLFLDEVTEASPEIQAKLLRAVEQGVVTPLGGDDVEVDVRIIVASNRPPRWFRENPSRFRQDLFGRLAQCAVLLPPLRERIEDVPWLWHGYLQDAAGDQGKEPPKYGEDVVEFLCAQRWPRNLRELRNLARTVVVLWDGARLTAADVQANMFPLESGDIAPSRGDRLEDVMREHIGSVLERCRGNVAQASRVLDMPSSSLYDWLKKHDLLPDRTQR